MKTREELNEIKEEVKALTEEELAQITGGNTPISPSPAVPVAAPPICYYKEGKKKTSFFAPARCTPFTRCLYYDECANPKKPKGNPHKIK